MELKNMTLNELWDLFPITFVNSDNQFKEVYYEEEQNLKLLLGNYTKRISHIGSTSIKNIKTKPIIDILIEINFDNKDIVKDVLLNNDYILMSESINKISFNKGYTINGYSEKVFHIHIKKYGDCDELYFRDYLSENQIKAIEYEKLKLELFNKCKSNRDLYTDGKQEFVNEIVNLAKEKYKNRYKKYGVQ
ncbi:MAG: GrpB family protein [Clostridia bacterium]|nr:GrpB family protein [Clostridia bacterium]